MVSLRGIVPLRCFASAMAPRSDVNQWDFARGSEAEAYFGAPLKIPISR